MTANAPSPSPTLGGADLLRSLDLFVDGPVLWGHPIPESKPGVFIVELPAPQPLVAIDPSAIRAWLERVPDLRLDGRRPTVAELQARLASFWLPTQTILYVGASVKSVGARLAGMYKTQLGDRRPQPAGYWLKTLHDLAKTRIWWAATDDAELYEDAALDAFVAAAGTLPFAVLATPSGVRRAHGVTGALRADEDAPALGSGLHATPGRPPRSAAAARSDELARARAARLGVRVSALGGSEADPEAARKAAAKAPPKVVTPPSPAAAPSAVAAPAGRKTTSGTRTGRTAAPKAPAGPPPAEPVYLSAAGLDALKAELEELTTHRRLEVIARVKAARELGDLRENADYEAARKEQSFLEGRVIQIEQLIKNAVTIDETDTGQHVVMGSTVVLDSVQHGEETYQIVGSAEADAAAGKISYTSPIGKALMGRRAGEQVTIRVPAGDMQYTIVEVR